MGKAIAENPRYGWMVFKGNEFIGLVESNLEYATNYWKNRPKFHLVKETPERNACTETTKQHYRWYNAQMKRQRKRAF